MIYKIVRKLKFVYKNAIIYSSTQLHIKINSVYMQYRKKRFSLLYGSQIAARVSLPNFSIIILAVLFQEFITFKF